ACKSKREPDEESITCRACGVISAAPLAAQNSPAILLARGIAEVAAFCGVSLDEFWCSCIALKDHSPLTANTWKWVVDYYMECRRERSVGNVLRPSATAGQLEFLSVVFGIGREVVGPARLNRLARLIRRLDLDPSSFFDAHTNRSAADYETVDWCEVLGI